MNGRAKETGIRVDKLPSGRRGLILGEIFGLTAGLTCTELWLLRFLGSRPFDCFESPYLRAVEPAGEATSASCGLGNPDVFAVMGALAGPYFGVCRADIVGVKDSTIASVVLMGLSAGFVVDGVAASGRTISSMICSMSASAAAVCSFKLEDR